MLRKDTIQSLRRSLDVGEWLRDFGVVSPTLLMEASMNKHIPFRKRVLAYIMAAVLMPQAGVVDTVKAEEAGTVDAASSLNYYQGDSYLEYLGKYEGAAFGKDVHVAAAADYSESWGDVGKAEGQAVYTGEDSEITWQFDIQDAGLYHLQLEYMPAKGNQNNIERNILIDGEILYKEMQYVTFTRIWKDVEGIKQDINGNDIRPAQEEAQEWKTAYVYDSARYSNTPLAFYLDKGVHTITIQGVREPMYLASVAVRAESGIRPYSEVKAEYGRNGFSAADTEPIRLQAEHMLKKSDYTLYQSADRSSAITEPQHPSKVKLNQISGNQFKLAGQWVTWEVEVPKDGLYNIALRYKQDLLSGLFTSRTLLIDGEIPFKEARNLSFGYSGSWQVKALGNKEERYDFYLTAGIHTITLEVTLGDMADVIAQVDKSLSEMNKIYREILLITGADADIYRDYNFDERIPETIENMQIQADILKKLSAYLEEVVGAKGEQVVALDKLSRQLEKMHTNPSSIASGFSQYKDNIASLADWIANVSEQPLSIDYIEVMGSGGELPKAEARFFQAVLFELRSFFSSFSTDYSTLGQTILSETGDGQATIEVWVTSGRDQSNIIRQLINSSFTPQTGINVDLKLVSAGTLLPSVLSSQGPDIALGNAIGDPINYAMRNAVIDLSQFSGYEEVQERFHESALVSYSFGGSVYALPETQTFPIMFYRKDILEELGLTIPNTWDEFFKVVSILQRNNMEVGFPQGMGGMQIFLYQNGGSLYNEDLTKSTFSEDATLDAFQSMLELFTTYRFPRDYSFQNRFRTGQMPLAIQDYTEYNGLSAFAPEIKGLWGMAPIPGTVGEDGEINRASACGGSCAMMLRGTDYPKEAWKFLEWWTRADIQASFAQEMKSVLGKAAMHATANMEAIASLPWTKEEYTALYEQWKYVTGTPEVPGNYYVTRNIGFASVSGYKSGNADELLKWTEETNDEIARKRQEFDLDQ